MNIQPKLQQFRQKRLLEVKKDAPSCLKTFKKAYAGHSRRAAIKAFCLECIGFDRSEIRNCAAFACPLWEVRPFRGRKAFRTAELCLKSA